MEIRTECPACKTVYHLPETMLGKSMRCPLPTCKQVFKVENPQPTALGDMIPVLPSEEIAPPASKADPATPPSWATAPPPVRGEKGSPSTAPPERKEPPRVVQAGSWEAPPIRTPGEEAPKSPVLPSKRPTRRPTRTISDTVSEGPDTVEEAETELPPVEEQAPPLKGRLARMIIVPFFILVMVGMGGGAFLVYNEWKNREERQFASAEADYDKGLFGSAGQKYDRLANDFPDSDRAERYRFRARLSDLRGRVNDQGDFEAILGDFQLFLEEYAKTPLLSDHSSDIGDSLVRLLVDHAKGGHEDPEDKRTLEDLQKAQEVVRMARAIKRAKDARPVAWVEIDAAMNELRAAAEKAQERKRVLAALEELTRTPSYASLLLAERLLSEEGPKFPGLADSPRVKEAIESLYRGHLASVKYVREPASLAAGVRSEEDDSPAILVSSLLAGSPGNPPPNDPVVLALARGVLYGLSETNGRVRWARRVGIDTTTLPVRVPAGRGSSERILALSSDTARLDALDPDGNTLWSYRLGTPSLGRPLVVGQRAYLATYNGEVHEIELNEGRLLGRYLLGHRLTTGGAHDPATNLLYFPADDGCVYVLRTGADPGCGMILYTRHPAASLRGEPMILPPLGGDNGFMALNQTAGLRSTELKVYDLPLQGRDARPRTLKMRAEMDGWTWFPPFFDPEKIVLLTDAGMLGVFGIRQPGTADQPLFPLLPEGGLRMGSSGKDSAAVGRSTIVQVEGDDYWTLSLGQLQRHRLMWDPRSGPKLIPVWQDAPLLGSPLHEGQASQNGSKLIVVTQPPLQSTSWATCVDERRGELLWKRQLGLVCQREPIHMPMADGPPLLLALDQGGTLFTIDPLRFKIGENTRWLVDGRMTPLAGPLDENPQVPPVVLRTADGKSVFIVANPGAGKTLVIRHVKPAETGRSLTLSERRIEIRDRLAGPPALVGNHLVMPLADSDETLIRVSLNNDEVQEGPNWRLARTAPEAIGYILPLGSDRFLSTDGGRGLTVWEWPANGGHSTLPPGGPVPTLQLPGRVTLAPVRLPGPSPRFVIADPEGLSLLSVEENGDIRLERRWALPGLSAIYLHETAQGPRLALVAQRSRLIWLDPGQAEALWTHVVADDQEIIGQPLRREQELIVADQNGRYFSINIANGKASGEAYTLRGSIAATTGPVAFGEDRLLCPLSDGTLIVLERDKFSPASP